MDTFRIMDHANFVEKKLKERGSTFRVVVVPMTDEYCRVAIRSFYGESITLGSEMTMTIGEAEKFLDGILYGLILSKT